MDQPPHGPDTLGGGLMRDAGAIRYDDLNVVESNLINGDGTTGVEVGFDPTDYGADLDEEQDDEDYDEEEEEEEEEGWIDSLQRVSFFVLPCIIVFLLYLISLEIGFDFSTMSMNKAQSSTDLQTGPRFINTIPPRSELANDHIPSEPPLVNDPVPSVSVQGHTSVPSEPAQVNDSVPSEPDLESVPVLSEVTSDVSINAEPADSAPTELYATDEIPKPESNNNSIRIKPEPEPKRVFGPFFPPKLVYEYSINWPCNVISSTDRISTRSIVVDLTKNVPLAAAVTVKENTNNSIMKILYDKKQLKGGIRVAYEDGTIFDTGTDFTFEPLPLEPGMKVFTVRTNKSNVEGPVNFVFMSNDTQKRSIGHYIIIDTRVKPEDARDVCRRHGGNLADVGESDVIQIMKDSGSLIYSGMGEVWIDRILGSERESAFPVIFDFSKGTAVYNPDHLETLAEVHEPNTYDPNDDFGPDEKYQNEVFSNFRENSSWSKLNHPLGHKSPTQLRAERKASREAREHAEKSDRSKSRAVLCRFKYSKTRNDHLSMSESDLSRSFYEHVSNTWKLSDNDPLKSAEYKKIHSILKTQPLITHNGKTILHLAVIFDDERLFKLVPDHIYYMHRVDDEGWTALDHFQQSNKMGQLLLKRLALELDFFRRDCHSKSGDVLFFGAIGVNRSDIYNSAVKAIPKLILYTASAEDTSLAKIIDFVRTNNVPFKVDPFSETVFGMTFFDLANSSRTKMNERKGKPKTINYLNQRGDSYKKVNVGFDKKDKEDKLKGLKPSKLKTLAARKLKRDAAEELYYRANKKTKPEPVEPDTITINWGFELPKLLRPTKNHDIYWILSPSAKVTTFDDFFRETGSLVDWAINGDIQYIHTYHLVSKVTTKYFYDCFILGQAGLVDSYKYLKILLTLLYHTNFHYLDEEAAELKRLIAKTGHDFEKEFGENIEYFMGMKRNGEALNWKADNFYFELQNILAYNPYIKYNGKTIFHLAVELDNYKMLTLVTDRVPLLHVLDNDMQTCLTYGNNFPIRTNVLDQLFDRFEIEKAITPFPIEIKYGIYLLIGNSQRLHYKYNEANNRNGFLGTRIKIELDRNVLTVMRDSYAESLKAPELWYPDASSVFPYPFFEIKYIDQMGVDNGGLTDDWINLLLEHWFREDREGTGKVEDFTAPLFKLVNEESGLYAPNIAYPPEVFKFVGAIIAVAWFRCIGIGGTFIESIYRSIFRIEPFRVEHYELQSPGTMAAMGTFNREDLDGLEPDQSIDDYIEKHAEGQLYGNYKGAVDAIAEGFNIERSLGLWDEGLRFFKNHIKGTSSINPEEFSNVQHFFGSSSNYYHFTVEQKQTIATYREIVKEFTDEQRLLLLKFFTSRRRMPIHGLRYIYPRPILQLDFLEKGQFPTASTCFSALRLPKFDTKEELKRGLVFAIENAPDFALC